MPPNILNFPDEINIQIAKLLPGSAIKAIRASCKKLNGIASPYLFPALYISCHQLDLDVFRLVTNNPLLIGGVRELVIDDTTMFSSLADWRVYEAAAFGDSNWLGRRNQPYWDPDHPQVKFSKLASSSEGPDKAHHEFYLSVLKGHHENRLAHTDVTVLKQALPHLKSLRSLVMTNRHADELFMTGAQSHESTSPVVKMWRRYGTHREQRSPFPPRCDWMAHPARFYDREGVNTPDWLVDALERHIQLNDMVHAEEYARRGIMTGMPYTLAREARVVFVALEVLANPQICARLTEFRVDASLDTIHGGQMPGLSATLFNRESPFPNALATSFSVAHIIKFHLVIGKEHHYTDPPGGPRFMAKGRVARVLASMPNLEELLIEPHGMPVFDAITEDMAFPRLRDLKISCCDIDPNKFIEFLRRHSPTLELLSIQWCSINPRVHEVKWVGVIQQMSALQDEGTLKLKEADVTHVHRAPLLSVCGRKERVRGFGLPGVYHSWKFNGVWLAVEGDSEDEVSDENWDSDGFGDSDEPGEGEEE